MTSTPLENVTPWTTLGNWFSPFSRRHVFAAAVTSLNTISRQLPFPRAKQLGCITLAQPANLVPLLKIRKLYHS